MNSSLVHFQFSISLFFFFDLILYPYVRLPLIHILVYLVFLLYFLAYLTANSTTGFLSFHLRRN
jgi:hypothetical protein